jgi:hypothetical protein
VSVTKSLTIIRRSPFSTTEYPYILCDIFTDGTVKEYVVFDEDRKFFLAEYKQPIVPNKPHKMRIGRFWQIILFITLCVGYYVLQRS